MKRQDEKEQIDVGMLSGIDAPGTMKGWNHRCANRTRWKGRLKSEAADTTS